MTFLKSAPLTLAAGVLLAIAGCAGANETASVSAPDSPVVAEFGGQTLTFDELEQRFARTSGAAPEEATFDDYVDFLERYVDFRLKVAEARRIGLDRDPEILEEISSYRDQLAQPFLIEREVLEDIIRDLYEKQKEEVAAAHILLLVPEHAPPADTLAAYQTLTAIRDSIAAGKIEFAAAAARHSEDPSAAQNQGYLGFFTGGRMILPFEEMAYSTPVGELSPVFRTQFGYHVLHVTDRRPAEPEIRASHILIRLAPESTPEQEAQAYAQMAELQERLAAGEAFADLARHHSQDPGSAQRGGDLGYFARDRMVEEFATAAYELREIGEVSDVVRSQFGLHLIELTGRQDEQTFDQQYETLKRIAERLPRTHERRQEIGRAHRDAVGSTLDTALVHRAVATYTEADILNQVREHGFGRFADSVFATIGEETFTLGEFTDHLRAARVNPAPDQRAQVVTLLDQLLNERAIALAAQGLEERNPEFRQIMAEYTDGVLLFRLKEDSVWSAAARDTVALEAYYEARADQYVFPERHRVVAFYSRTDSLLHMAGSMLADGHAPEAILTALDDPEAARRPLRVDTLFLAAPSGGFFDHAFDLEQGQFTEPARHRGEFVLLYLDGIEPPRQMTFEEARAQVITAYQEVVEQSLVERLRREANVRLYPERLRAAFSQDGEVLLSDRP